MNTLESDLDLNNYSVFDILGLFDLPYDYTDHNLNNAENKLKKIKTEIDDDSIINFYDNAYSSLNCLHKFRENRKISNPKYLNNHFDDNKVIKAVISKPNISKYDSVLTLLQEILNEHEDLNITYENSIKPNPTEIPTNKGTNYYDLANDKSNLIVNTFSNIAVPGKINSLKRIVQYQNLHMSSCFRDKYYDSNPCNFHYNLPSEIKNVLSIRLSSIEIPNAWYLFSFLKGNNRFKIEITSLVPCKGKKCNVYNIIVPDGNYDSDTLIDFLNKNYFCYSDTEDDNLKNIKISVDKFSNKTEFKIISKKPEEMVFSLHFTEDSTDNMMNTLGWTLGFRLAKYLKIDESIQSEGLFDAGGDRYIYFSLNDYQYNVNESNTIFFDETTISENVLAKIPTVNGKLCLIVDENEGSNFTKTRRFNGPINLKKLQIKIMDRFGDIIDLNHMDYSFTLELEILYERNAII
tara:strand:+ start:2872 stop:4260 length:1389 start_codon:yes stop_codon:yes gene_type:complete